MSEGSSLSSLAARVRESFADAEYASGVRAGRELIALLSKTAPEEVPLDELEGAIDAAAQAQEHLVSEELEAERLGGATFPPQVEARRAVLSLLADLHRALEPVYAKLGS